MPRLLPDTDLLVSTLLRPALGTGVTVTTEIPDNATSVLPLVIATRIPAGGAVHPRFLDRATVSVEAWHHSKQQASDLAEETRVALYAAWEQQLTTLHGHIAYYDEMAAPAEIRTEDQPAEVFRYQASYVLATRPPL